MSDLHRKRASKGIQGSTAAVSQSATIGDTGFTLQPNGKVKSLSTMTFAPDGQLIIADWKSNALYSLALPEVIPSAPGSFNVCNLDRAIAQALGKRCEHIRVTKVLFEPTSNKAILSVETGSEPEAPVIIAIFSHSGEGQLYNLDELITGTFSLKDRLPEADLWEQAPVRSFLVTAMKAYGSELLVAGLANTDFSSTLRRIAYPFSDEVKTTSVEIYHAIHNQLETRAPIRAFSVVDISGSPHVLAAYTCTPLVTIPLSDLQEGAHVRGKTIAELGYGNTPLDVVPFEMTYQDDTSDWVAIANSSRAVDLVSLKDIVAATHEEGLSEPVKVPFETRAGVPAIPAPITNAVCLVDQGKQFLLSLRRNPTAGDLQLVSIGKGAFFRLSDFVNEYDFPNYSYPEGDSFQQNYIRPFHKKMKTDEGYEALAK